MSIQSNADDVVPPLNTKNVSQMIQGGTGLLKVPTARMSSEGDLSVNYFDTDEYRFWSVSLQLFPWLESTIRYTDIRTVLFSQFENFSGNQTLKDKGIDVKFRLLEESYYLPEMSVLIRDIGGTGLFGSEFIGASKRFGPLDFHIGLGFGILGDDDEISNPLCKISSSFCERPIGVSGEGGQVEYNKFFKGPTSLIGGIEYQTPWQPLGLKLEYEGHDYSNDRAGNLAQDSKWNIGAVYKWGNFDFTLSYLRGNTVSFGFSYQMNLHSIKQVKIDEPPLQLTAQSKNTEFHQVNKNQLAQDLYLKAGFVVRTSDFQEDELILYGNQIAYRDDKEAIDRIGRLLVDVLPNSIKTYRIVLLAENLPMVETVVDAEQFAAAARYENLLSDTSESWDRREVSENSLENFKPKKRSGFISGLEPFYIQSIGAPERFYMYQVGLLGIGGYKFNDNLKLLGNVKLTLFENFDEFNFTVDAQNTPLPRVRTYVREYATRSRLTLENLYLQSQERLAPNLYGQLYGGYLETMFGGVGGEILYRPLDSNFAFGLDLNYVKQRSFEDNYSFIDYEAFTGHANIYWQPGFLDNVLLTFNIGQYLAKDRGVTFDFAKRFDSGMIIGAYAAITNVSAEDYGEGSFTKGFYMKIPFDLFSIRPSIGGGRLDWVPIGRDGGQTLNRPVKLIDITANRSNFR
ncbi:MAG: polysaccharide biosynthesis protein [Gammaproteobacteria bacterium]|nr:MAG: polysaccharide biosynthesis protein [Gammaproteobacteria bacterium]